MRFAGATGSDPDRGPRTREPRAPSPEPRNYNPPVDAPSPHRADAPASVRAFVLTISDTRSEATDTSGAAIVEVLTAAGHTITGRKILRDDPAPVASAVRGATVSADVIITTGGTGITSRDSTFEAIAQLFEKRLDGFGELFRMLSYQQIGAAAMLSRACAGTIRKTIVFTLPGSEKAVRLAMEKLILPEIGHVVRELEDERVNSQLPTSQLPEHVARAHGRASTYATSHRLRTLHIGTLRRWHVYASAMRPIKTTIPFREALELTLAAVTPIDRTERVALADAGGRVLAETIAAGADVPPFARAAMDGFAVRAADTLGATGTSPKTLRSVDVIFTGDAPRRPLAAGECAEIATGAPVPDGADAVVMVEETDRADGSSRRDSVAIQMAVRPGQNVTPRANDIKAGEQLLAPGDLLTPSRLGVCAAAGRSHVVVYARPVVAMVSTGNEIVEPGQPLGPAQIYDINRFTLSAAVALHGGVARVLPSAPDDLPALTAMLVEATRSADIFVFSGGSSVGERDLVLDAIRAGRRSDLPRHRREARQADGARPRQRAAGAGHAG